MDLNRDDLNGDGMNARREIEDLLDAYALDALEPHERDRVEAAIELDPELATRAARLVEAAALLGAPSAQPPRLDVRSRVLEGAMHARPAGTAVLPDPNAPVDPRRGFVHHVGAFGDLIEDLGEHEWSVIVHDDWTVKDQVAHTIAAFAYCAENLGIGTFEMPAGVNSHAEHILMTQPTMDRHRSMSIGETRAECVAVVRRLVDYVGDLDDADLGRIVRHYNDDVPLGLLLIIRFFEAWAHADLIRKATGRELVVPDSDELKQMCDLGVKMAPLAMLITGRSRPDKTIRVVLTGIGGGAWTLGPKPPAEADCMVVTGSVDYCRLAGGTLRPDTLTFDASGDLDVVNDVIESVPVFAL